MDGSTVVTSVIITRMQIMMEMILRIRMKREMRKTKSKTGILPLILLLCLTGGERIGTQRLLAQFQRNLRKHIMKPCSFRLLK